MQIFGKQWCISNSDDVDNRFSEENEADHVIMLTLPISVPNLLYLLILLRDTRGLE